MTYTQFRHFAHATVGIDTDTLFLCGEAQLGCTLKHDGQELLYELVDYAETPRKVLEHARGWDGFFAFLEVAPACYHIDMDLLLI